MFSLQMSSVYFLGPGSLPPPPDPAAAVPTAATAIAATTLAALEMLDANSNSSRSRCLEDDWRRNQQNQTETASKASNNVTWNDMNDMK